MKSTWAISRVSMELQSNVSETVSASIVITTARRVTHHSYPDDGGRNSLRNVRVEPHTYTADLREDLIANYA
jgi:hypothetical protein